MENNTNERIYAYKVEKKFLGVDITQSYDNSGICEVDRKRVLKDTKLSINQKTEEITIKANGKSFTALGLYHIGENGRTNYFKDKESGKFYLLKDGALGGPYNSLLSVRADMGDEDLSRKGELFTVTDENDQIMEVDSDLNVAKTGNKYIDSNVVQNEEGKYAYAYAGDPVTDFMFDNPTIESTRGYANYKTYHDKTTGRIYVCNTQNKLISTLENFGRIKEFHVTSKELALIMAEKGTAIVDMGTGKIMYQTNEPAVSCISDNLSYFVSIKGGKSIYAEQDSSWTNEEGFKKSSTIKEFPFEACAIKGGCIQAKNKDGKVGIVDKDGKVLLDFDYEDPKIPYYENKTDRFIPIVKDGKMGIFNTETKKVEIKPFCKSFSLDRQMCEEVAQGQGLYRFMFTDKNGKVGVVNNKGHIVIEPVLRTSNSFNGMFSDSYSYMECKFGNDIGDRSRVCVSLKNPEIFPVGQETHYSSVNKTVEETHSRNKYSDGEVLAGTVVAGQLLGGVGAIGAYGYLSSQKETYKTTRNVKEEKRTYTNYNVLKGVLNYIHMDTADLPKELQGEAQDLPKPMTIEEYEEKKLQEKQARIKKKAKDKKEVQTESEKEIEEISFE